MEEARSSETDAGRARRGAAGARERVQVPRVSALVT